MRIVGFLSLLLLFQLVTTTDMDLRTLSTSIAHFSAKFCNELSKNTSVVSSPLSAEIVLALLTLGTTDPAHSELLNSLAIPNDDLIRSSFSLLSSNLRSIKGVTLNVANKVYIKDGDYELAPQLKEDAVKVFDAGLEKVNFSDSATVKLINNWVESKTNNKIIDLLASDSCNDDTRLILVNALYFKGSWKKKFNPSNTRDQPFHINEESTVDVPMMYKEDDYKYGQSEELRAQLLEIPYEGDAASMLIVLPDEITGLDEVLQKLAGGYDLMAELEKMYKIKVQVTIPKFKIETEIDLKTLLPKLGINAIFDSHNSGLTKLLANNESLYVTKAVQKAFIEVNEDGAEAAAATAMGIMFCCAIIDEPPVPRFVADRPFLAAILVDGSIYFMASQRAFGVMMMCAVVSEEFSADRPFLGVFFYKQIPLFWSVYRKPPS